MRQLDDGLLGKVVRYKSGKTKLLIGNTRFDLNLGMEPGLLQVTSSLSKYHPFRLHINLIVSYLPSPGTHVRALRRQVAHRITHQHGPNPGQTQRHSRLGAHLCRSGQSHKNHRSRFIAQEPQSSNHTALSLRYPRRNVSCAMQCAVEDQIDGSSEHGAWSLP